MTRFLRGLLGGGWGLALSVISAWLFACIDMELSFSGDWACKIMTLCVWIIPAALGIGMGLMDDEWGWFEIWEIFSRPLLGLVINLVIFLILMVIGFFVTSWNDGSILGILFLIAILGVPAGLIIIILGA